MNKNKLISNLAYRALLFDHLSFRFTFTVQIIKSSNKALNLDSVIKSTILSIICTFVLITMSSMINIFGPKFWLNVTDVWLTGIVDSLEMDY